MVSPDDITEEDTAVYAALALSLLERVAEYEAEHGPKSDGHAIPRAVMTYGEVEALAAGLVTFATMAFPSLKDRDRLLSIVAGVTGRLN